MTGADYIHLTLSRTDWRLVHKAMAAEQYSGPTLLEIENQCRATSENKITVTMQVGMAWPMSNAIRPTLPQVADQLARMLGAWWWTWQSADGS